MQNIFLIHVETENYIYDIDNILFFVINLEINKIYLL